MPDPFTLAAAGISSLGSIASGMLGYDMQKKLMSQQNEYNKQNWQHQWDTAYSPQAQVKNWMSMGFSPASLMGESGSLPAPTSAQPSPVSIPDSGQAGVFSSAFRDIGSAVASLSQARKTMKEGDKITDLVDSEIARNLSQQQLNDVDADYKRVLTDFERMFGKEMRDAQVKRIVQRTATDFALSQLYATQGETEKAQAQLNRAMEYANYALGAQHHEMVGLLQTEGKYRERLLQSVISSNVASAQRDVSQAGLNTALAKTEDESREYKVDNLQIARDIGLVDRSVAYSTKEEQISAAIARAEQIGLVNDKMRTEIDRLRRENDWIELEKIVGLGATIIGSATGAYNAQTSRLNTLQGEERNRLQSEFQDRYFNRTYHERTNYYNAKGKLYRSEETSRSQH